MITRHFLQVTSFMLSVVLSLLEEYIDDWLHTVLNVSMPGIMDLCMARLCMRSPIGGVYGCWRVDKGHFVDVVIERAFSGVKCKLFFGD